MEEVIFIFIYVGLGCVVMALYTASDVDEFTTADYIAVGLGVCFWPFVAIMLAFGVFARLLAAGIRRLLG